MRSLQTTRNAAFKAVLLAGGAGIMALSQPALAQDEEGTQDTSGDPVDVGPVAESEPTGPGIVVTGSRIRRGDFEANSPFVTVDEALLENSSTAAIETNLNKLPQFTPAQTPALGADIQPTATNTPGAATISLRGIGSNRNLVLIDGRRGTPSNATGVVDISTIPSAAIERTEIISGGSSATYGADAVAGVTNFILKKNFQGLELDAQAGISQRGDSFEHQISGIMGSDFADGRGNISLALSMNDREASYRRNRSWYRDFYADPNADGTQFFIDRPGILLDGAVGANPATGLDDMFPEGTFSPFTNGTTVYLNEDGTPFVNGSYVDSSGVRHVNFYGYNGPVDGVNYKVTNAGTLEQNNTDLQLVLPLTRYNALARGNYEINDWIGVFGQAMFSHVHTETQNEPGPITGGWGVSIDPTGLDRDQLPSSLWALLDSRQHAARPGDPGYIDDPDATQPIISDANDPFSITALMPDNRATFTDVTTYNLLAGLEGSIPGSDWTWDMSVNHGVSSTYAKQTGIYSLQRLRTVMNSGNFGEGFVGTGNPEQGGFGASTATCTSGLNFFVPPVGGFSEDCLEAVRADLKNRSLTTQNIVEANAQGKVLDLPAGELRAAIGANYRKLDFEFDNDTLTTQGRSFIDQALGIYPSGNSAGSVDAKEIYGELLVPVLEGVPFIEALNLEIGGRISDYNTTGTSYTYKVVGDWEVNNWLRFRGGYNRAERAPNIAELYLARQQTFGANTLGDLCSRANPTPYSANPANANGENVYQTCLAMMPNEDAADAYYSGPGATDNSAFGFAWPSAEGNPNLTPEKADTWTAGVVVNSPFDTPLLSRLRLAVDYYNISVEDAIGQQTVGIALRQCFDAELNPLVTTDPVAAAATAACQAITRDSQTGGLGNVNLTYANNGRFQLEGIDAQLDWGADLGPGTLNINSQFTYLLHFYSAELPTDPEVDYAGSMGPTANGLNGDNYRWRLFSTANYVVGPFMLGLQWQHLPAIEDATEPLFPTDDVGAPAYDIFHLNGSYRVTDNVSVRFGVDNLFDKAPPLTNYNPANDTPEVDGQLRDGGLGGLFYDDIGRRFYLGANFKF